MSDLPEDIDDLEANRAAAMRAAGDAAAAGCPIAGAMFALEQLAIPFYLGLDTDPNDEDLAVWP